ncbi:S-adenosyl-L-methionine-dependent methyltransferase [Martensiomyces pterosporus]|nr:S-adenosyl-L-methionine-dependent methyltransferase [Martensiomyces pterosporus]
MATLGDSSTVYSSVKDYYGKVLASSKDLKTSACTAGSAPHPLILDIIKRIPHAVTDKFYGCGNPIPLGIQGRSVLDLGSGSGRDCYVAASLVGPQGSVVGVDMTDEQLQTARESIAAYSQALGYTPNLKFLTGYIESLAETGVAKESIDVCISNCVINLSPDKPRVLKGVYESLRSGGEMHFSDIYADSQLPDSVRTHDVLLGEGLAGALYSKEFEQIASDIGFARPRVLSISHIDVYDVELKKLVGDTKFYSITYRLFKVPQPDGERELDQGQTATYLGTIEGCENEYALDVNNVFPKGVPVKVSGNTAAVLTSAWLAGYFEVTAGSTGSESQAEMSIQSTESLMAKATLAALCGASSSASSGCSKPMTK